MADVHSSETRSFNMSHIHGKDTKPEMIVRKYLFSRGLRYRVNDGRYPGKPDLIFPKYRTVLFVNGCFWHMHENCKYAKLPKSNISFWEKKLSDNKNRDKKNYEDLEKMGWRVLLVWECQLKKDTRGAVLDELYQKVIGDK